MRGYSSVHTQQPAGPVREIELDPYIMLDDDIKYVTQDIRDVSNCDVLVFSFVLYSRVFIFERRHFRFRHRKTR